MSTYPALLASAEGSSLLEPQRKKMWHRMAAKLKATAGEQYKQVRVILRALVHPGVPWHVKLICGCGMMYVVSPIQVIPNFIPVIGQMDDVLVIGLCIRLLKRSISPAVLEECQKKSTPRLEPGVTLDHSVPASGQEDSGQSVSE
jgi:uncharacterized membrane protein YkvA (DUF1232 family)